ncbi:MAG: glycogen debranching protein GlgX [Lachnospiraceae bacterium]|nr:glycogen debranching protein GlgX [Lachnospiraceae bacterium]
MNENRIGVAEHKHLLPLEKIKGYDVRPGFYGINGATALREGVSFTVCSMEATDVELLLYHRGERKPYAVLPFPKHYRIGRVYSMFVFGLDIYDFEYAYRVNGPYDPQKGLIFDKKKPLLDPYARAVTGQSVWGEQPNLDHEYRARVVVNDFDWGDHADPVRPIEDLIIYELHVRGFTKDASSGVRYPGTFEGIREKIPYLKDLGITAVELMPVFEFDETMGRREVNGRTLLDYWGYNPVSFFSPNTSYTAKKEFNREGDELKALICELNANGIEVILDVVFNHTAEGNENGPFFSFKGFDNRIYYMLTPEGMYYNFSGCGNTLNCNHPVVQQLILECLRYWTIEYHVDGFRFDLASILGRNEDGSPASQPPLLKNLAEDPILRNVKLIAEAWDAGGLYQVGSFPAFSRWAEWNGKYRDDMRSFLKGDFWYAKAAASRLTGSLDLYSGQYRGYASSINFLTCHDGFSLWDLYSYNGKHNEDNGWNNTDGHDDNRSWNCGAEGETEDSEICRLRLKMMKNACVSLMCSRGTPMFLAGDEFGDTRFGNNNPYCQDNEISWLDWKRLDTNKELYLFFKKMIWFRRRHPVIRSNQKPSDTGFPAVSVHTNRPWDSMINQDTKGLAICYAGKTNQREDLVYVAFNVYWEGQTFELPKLPEMYEWRCFADTALDGIEEECKKAAIQEYWLKPRSVAVFVAHRKKQ